MWQVYLYLANERQAIEQQQDVKRRAQGGVAHPSLAQRPPHHRRAAGRHPGTLASAPNAIIAVEQRPVHHGLAVPVPCASTVPSRTDWPVGARS